MWRVQHIHACCHVLKSLIELNRYSKRIVSISLSSHCESLANQLIFQLIFNAELFFSQTFDALGRIRDFVFHFNTVRPKNEFIMQITDINLKIAKHSNAKIGLLKVKHWNFGHKCLDGCMHEAWVPLIRTVQLASSRTI